MIGHRLCLAAFLAFAVTVSAAAEDNGPVSGHEARDRTGGEAAPPPPPLPEPRASVLPGAAALLSGLFQVQDSIVKGERSALKLQSDILRMMREQLLAMRGKPILPETDIGPVLLFGLAGGDPVAAVQVLSFVPGDHPDAELSRAVVSYLRRETRAALSRFETIDPLALPLPLGAYVAMAKGNAAMAENREVAVRNFDLVRLLAPGTLLEEVALRRLVWLHAGSGDAPAFHRAAASYANRFATSPYFGQFLKFFMQGVIRLPTDDGIRVVLDLLPEDARVTVKMRLSRDALIAGRDEIADIVSASLLSDLADSADERVQRAHLYAGMSQVAKGRLVKAWGMLRHVDRDSVPPADRELLDAALHAVREATDGDPESAAMITSALGDDPADGKPGEGVSLAPDARSPAAGGRVESPLPGAGAGQAPPLSAGETGMETREGVEAGAIADLKPLFDKASEQMKAVDELLRNLPK
ncbi:hypothetical protein ACLB6G_18350 [Zhengella sp. ZM62]|uniref:hypothetical protein n=1 Tax=Zhengella sedimenti TaxID=3390035 RepID=UPI00397496FD